MPIWAAAKGSLPPLKYSRSRKLTKMPCAVGARGQLQQGLHLLLAAAVGAALRPPVAALAAVASQPCTHALQSGRWQGNICRALHRRAMSQAASCTRVVTHFQQGAKRQVTSCLVGPRPPLVVLYIPSVKASASPARCVPPATHCTPSLPRAQPPPHMLACFSRQHPPGLSRGAGNQPGRRGGRWKF